MGAFGDHSSSEVPTEPSKGSNSDFRRSDVGDILDPRYEFDAPKMRYDLAKATDLDTSADQWFGMYALCHMCVQTLAICNCL